MSQMPVTISGNLTANPEFQKFEESGAKLCKLRVATSRRYRTEETDAQGNPVWNDTDVLYVTVECWGQLAVNAAVSLRKGFPVLVTGLFVSESWQKEVFDHLGNSKEETQYKTKLKASRIGFELSNFQVSSVRTNVSGNTLEGQEKMEAKTAEDLLAAPADDGDAAPF
ncbi:single-stranded DNA-binding protein [Corynebacterium mayonis]|uniref:single-stranded DNA-binding protein n=1 Tax=Corynebacterium mayonis TaxID=3062461 RepID=UPI00313FFE79